MKIINIITRLDFGGSSENLIDICRKLRENGFDIVVIYGGNIVFNFEFKYYHIKYLKREVDIINDIKSFFKILKIMFKEEPDIIHTHTSKAGIIGRWAGFIYRLFSKRRLKIIHTPHGHIFYGYFSKFKSRIFLFIEKITASITDCFIALTENEKKESISYQIGKSDKWCIIPSGIDYNIKIENPAIRHSLNITGNKIIIGSVLRFEKVKGVEYMVRSVKYFLELIKDKTRTYDFLFLIVGDGSLMNKVKEIARSENTSEYIIFAGYQKNVVDFINIMDIYVQPSLNEGLGRTVIMAELLKKPIIASGVCGLKDLVIDSYNGFLVRPGEPFEIAEKILYLYLDKDLRIEMGKRSYELVNRIVDGFKVYSLEREYFLLTNLYYKITDRKQN